MFVLLWEYVLEYNTPINNKNAVNKCKHHDILIILFLSHP